MTRMTEEEELELELAKPIDHSKIRRGVKLLVSEMNVEELKILRGTIRRESGFKDEN